MSSNAFSIEYSRFVVAIESGSTVVTRAFNALVVRTREEDKALVIADVYKAWFLLLVFPDIA